jgi:hypothetical protein
MRRFETGVANEWKRLHPEVGMVTEPIPGSGEYVSKMLTAFLAGTEPDMRRLDASSAAVFIENDALLDLMPFVKEEKFDLSVYYLDVLDLARPGASCSEGVALSNYGEGLKPDVTTGVSPFLRFGVNTVIVAVGWCSGSCRWRRQCW